MRNLGNSVAWITNCVFVYVVVIMTTSGKSIFFPATTMANPLAASLTRSVSEAVMFHEHVRL